MKKTIQLIAMALLCLFFAGPAMAQITPLEVGSKVPDSFWTQKHHFTVDGKSADQDLSAYRGKPIILDFWATWCSPCIAMVPKLDSLQRQFDGKVQILPVSYQSHAIIGPTLQRLYKGKTPVLPEITSDKILNKYFVHKYLPHYVWIDATGTVSGMTSYQDVTATNIKALLDKTMSAAVKKDKTLKYDASQPILIGAPANGPQHRPMIYSSALARYIPGVTAEYLSLRKDSTETQKVFIRNCGLSMFYRVAYSRPTWFSRSRIIYEVKDLTPFKGPANRADMESWKTDHAYNYELIVPKSIGDDMFKFMQDDGRKFFPQYQVSIENRSIRSLALVSTSSINKVQTKGGAETADLNGQQAVLNNVPLMSLIARLNILYLQDSPYPLIDETGIKGNVDLVINANLSNIEDINRELARYDLQFVKKDAVIPVMVIRDNENQTSSLAN